jgi:hypothetical protein
MILVMCEDIRENHIVWVGENPLLMMETATFPLRYVTLHYISLFLEGVENV